jgi:hypothetical protein
MPDLNVSPYVVTGVVGVFMFLLVWKKTKSERDSTPAKPAPPSIRDAASGVTHDPEAHRAKTPVDILQDVVKQHTDEVAARIDLALLLEVRDQIIIVQLKNKTDHVLRPPRVLVRDAMPLSLEHGRLIKTRGTHAGKGESFRPVYLDPDRPDALYPDERRSFGLTGMHNRVLTIAGRPPGAPSGQLAIPLRRKGEWHVTIEVECEGRKRTELIRFTWDGAKIVMVSGADKH